MLGTLLQPEIKELINNREFSILKEVFSEWAPADIAELINDLDNDDKLILFRLLPKSLATATFEHLGVDNQKEFLKLLGQKQVADILNTMSPDDRTALLEELPPSVTKQLLVLLTREEREIALSLLGFEENSIGRLMTPDYISVDDSMTVEHVLNYIREKGHDTETLNIIYVVDGSGKLIDDIQIRQFLLSPLDKVVSNLMDFKYVCLYASDDQEIAVSVFKKYGLFALPVIDSEGYLLGIVTIDDVLDVFEEEVTEDIHKMGGMEALDEPYMAASLFKLTKKRASWLVVLFLGEMLTATAMGYFEEEIARAIVLALFIPLIISSGGNSGSQASTLIIRAMAVGEVRLRDWWRVFIREIASGFMLGVILGLIGFLRIAIWQQFFNLYGTHWIKIAITVGLSLIGVVMWGTFSGSMLPFVLRKLGFDPATSSAPFVATIVDVTGLIIYFSIALIVLKGALL